MFFNFINFLAGLIQIASLWFVNQLQTMNCLDDRWGGMATSIDSVMIIVCTHMIHAQHQPSSFTHPHAHTLSHTHINQFIIPSIKLSLHLTLFESLPISLSFILLIQPCHVGH